MATVIGKTSTRIDQLLADVVVSVTLVDGSLVVTKRDGTTQNLGNPGGIRRIFYTNGAWPSRPAGAADVQWIGPTYPAAMTERDDWLIVP
jgi:hypothetical protein